MHKSVYEMSWTEWEELDIGDVVYRPCVAALYPDLDVRRWAIANHAAFTVIGVVAVMGAAKDWAAYMDMTDMTFLADPMEIARTGLKVSQAVGEAMFPSIADNPRWRWRY